MRHYSARCCMLLLVTWWRVMGGERGLLPSDVLPVLRRLINPDSAP